MRQTKVIVSRAEDRLAGDAKKCLYVRSAFMSSTAFTVGKGAAAAAAAATIADTLTSAQGLRKPIAQHQRR